MSEIELTDKDGRTHTVQVSKADLLRDLAVLEKDKETLKARVKALDRRIQAIRWAVESLEGA